MDGRFRITNAQRICRTARRFAAWALAAAVVALPAVKALGDDAGRIQRLPPIHQTLEPRPTVEPRPAYMVAPAVFAPRETVPYPEHVAAYNVDPLGPVDPGFQLTSQREMAPSFGVSRQLFQPAGLKEPVPPPPLSKEDSSDTASTAGNDGDDSETEGNADNAEGATAPATQANGQPTTYGQRPVSNALQFLRTQDVLLDPGAWQADTGFAYSLFDTAFPAGVVDPNTGDLVGVVGAHIRQRLVYSPFAFRYGVTEKVQAFGVLPIGFSNTQTSTPGTSDSTNSGGLGDLTAGLNVHLRESCDTHPDVIGTFSFTAPTGDFSAPVFGVIPGAALGQGFWALGGNLLFVHRYDPLVVFYGVGYRHLFERYFDDVLFQAGEQISYQFGVGFSVNDRVTLSCTYQGFYITDIRQDRLIIPGTNLEPMSLRFAATIARNDKIVEPFALIGMTGSAPQASIGVTITYY